MKVFKFFLLLFVVSFFASNATAQEEEKEFTEIEKSLIESNRAISEWFDSVAEDRLRR